MSPENPSAGPSASSDAVRVRFRLSEDDGPAAETMWATPVQANSGGGTYRLNNIGFFAPVMVGDVVKTVLDVDGWLHVTEVVEVREEHLVIALLPSAAAEADARDVAASLEALPHTAVEFANPHVFVASSPDAALLNVMEELLDCGYVEGYEVRRVPGQERDWAPINFDPPTEPTIPEFTTDYWAPEDPYWESVGVTDPGVLAQIQTLASTDPRVAEALEAGRHDQVVRYMDRLARASRGERLPPLEGPLFTPRHPK